MKHWKYRNDTDSAVIWGGKIWESGDEKEHRYPIPSSVGLTVIQEGASPDPVLFHEDIVLQPNDEKVCELNGPEQCRNIALSLFCIGQGGAECRFNSKDNKPIPLDVRGFTHVIPWEFCARLYFKNVTDVETHISVSAVEVTA